MNTPPAQQGVSMDPGIERMLTYTKVAKDLLPGPGFLPEAGTGAKNPEAILEWTFNNPRASSRGNTYGREWRGNSEAGWKT